MMIRRAAIQDLEQIMQIYARAVQYMHASGNPNQWVEGYPSRALIEEDIARGVSYVVDRDGVIEAVFSYIEGEDPTYRQIGQGMWRTNGSYGTVHRLASAGRLRGVAGICFSWCAEQAKMHGCSSLRADTHQDNRIMQHLLQKNGFVYCGVIHLANGAPRLAFERAAVAPGGENPGVNPGMTNPNGMNPGGAYAGMPNANGMNPGGAYAVVPNPNGMNMGMPQQNVNVQPAQFQSFSNDSMGLSGQENIGLIKDVPLEVTVELGRTTKSISEILEFSPGTIIELDRIAGEPIDVLVNGKFVAKGEVVVIEESFGVRITEIIK